VFTFAIARWSVPARPNREDARQRIEGALVADHRSVIGLPPIPIEEARNDTVPAATMPNEKTTGREDTRELGDHSSIVRRLEEEAKRREEIQHGIEAPAPARRQSTHVASCVSQPRPRAATPGTLEEIARVVEAVDVEAGFSEQVRMPSLSARAVEHARTRW
jgi:hypothetical protein